MEIRTERESSLNGFPHEFGQDPVSIKSEHSENFRFHDESEQQRLLILKQISLACRIPEQSFRSRSS